MKISKELLSVFKSDKIGNIVRNTLPFILENNLISQNEIEKLQKDEYSKMIFDMNYPILKKVNENLPLEENRSVNYHTRYYSDPVGNNDTRYLITSEWYERNKEDYINWLKRKVKDE